VEIHHSRFPFSELGDRVGRNAGPPIHFRIERQTRLSGKRRTAKRNNIPLAMLIISLLELINRCFFSRAEAIDKCFRGQ
jgi:hypothetical protein